MNLTIDDFAVAEIKDNSPKENHNTENPNPLEIKLRNTDSANSNDPIYIDG